MFETGFIFWSAFLVLAFWLIVALLIMGIFFPCTLSHADALFGQEFCDLCGVRLRPFCPLCSSSYHPSASFCPDCGSALTWEASDQEG